MSGASHKNERTPGKKKKKQREGEIKEGLCRAAKSPSTFPGHWSVSQCLSQTHRSPPSTLHERESFCFCFCSVFVLLSYVSGHVNHLTPLPICSCFGPPGWILAAHWSFGEIIKIFLLGPILRNYIVLFGWWCYWTDGRDLVQSEKEERQFTARRTEMSAPIVRQEINGIQVGGFIFLGAHITNALFAGLNPIEWSPSQAPVILDSVGS